MAVRAEGSTDSRWAAYVRAVAARRAAARYAARARSLSDRRRTGWQSRFDRCAGARSAHRPSVRSVDRGLGGAVGWAVSRRAQPGERRAVAALWRYARAVGTARGAVVARRVR